MNRLFVIPAAVFLFTAGIVLTGCSSETGSEASGIEAGNHIITPDEITEFYWTVASSTFPPDYQRYYFYTEGDEKYFYHEKREGDRFPLQEEDITVSGTKVLSEAEWNEFYQLLCGGTVKARSENVTSGDDGPWLYLYWKKDKGKIQEYSFPNYGAQKDFEAFCLKLKQ